MNLSEAQLRVVDTLKNNQDSFVHQGTLNINLTNGMNIKVNCKTIDKLIRLRVLAIAHTYNGQLHWVLSEGFR